MGDAWLAFFLLAFSAWLTIVKTKSAGSDKADLSRCTPCDRDCAFLFDDNAKSFWKVSERRGILIIGRQVSVV